MPFSRACLTLLFAAGLFGLSACNMPGYATPTPSGVNLIYTAAAQTVQAQLTQVNQPPPSPDGTPLPPTPSGDAPSPTEPLETASPAAGTPAPSAGAAVCDLAEFEADVTYPDNADVDPGAAFVKTWRLRNAGTCTWTADYSAIFMRGDALGAPPSVSVTSGTVAPGETVDISVTLSAPASSGTYRGEWKLRNAAGEVFGLGSDGTKPFWVEIDVAVESGLLFDFVARAQSADWLSGTGDSPREALAFGGEDSSPAGAAKIKDRAPLETGMTSGKLLLMVPRQEQNGAVAGIFPSYMVQTGDHFKARLGFLTPDGSCGAGKAIFQLGYLEGEEMHPLKEWRKDCDGRLAPVDVDLSDFKGSPVRFVLVVKADGPFEGDWAIWNSPLIEH